MADLYLFSGLGADYRVFKFLDLSEHRVNYIHWITPYPNESIKGYAQRLIEQIKSVNPVLVGVSFGGIMAIEVSKLINYKKLIIISSIKDRNEIPFYFKLVGKIKLHKLIPACLLKRSNFISNWFFGVYSIQEKNLLKSIFKDTDPVFLKWALDKIVNWKNKQIPSNTLHIHGSKDRILPDKFIKSDKIINDGGHLMIVNKSDEISRIINSEILKTSS